MRKKKSKKPSTTIHPPSLQEGKEASQHAWTDWLQTPALNVEVFYTRFNQAGFIVTLLLFVGLGAYFIKGYSVRPRILDGLIVDRILNRTPGHPAKIVPIGQNHTITQANLSTGEKALMFQVKPGDGSGFIVSRDALEIPADAQNMGITLQCAYKGSPAVMYGFTKRQPGNSIPDWKQYLTGKHVMNMELPPSLQTHRNYISMASRFYTKEQFEVPWDEADFFYFIVTSTVPTEFFLLQIYFLEKY